MNEVSRWAVRESKDGGGYYMLFVSALGTKPQKTKKQWNPKDTGFAGYETPEFFEQVYPECYHLKPGGGPVEIKFVKVRQVKP